MGKHDRRETSGQPPDSRPVTIQVPLPVLGVVHGVRESVPRLVHRDGAAGPGGDDGGGPGSAVWPEGAPPGRAARVARRECGESGDARRAAVGQPGYVRVDSVHQGDCDGLKGLYYLNLVDEVTQFQFVGSVEHLHAACLVPVLQALLRAFPFLLRGFHTDNGSEYSNRDVAALLQALHVDAFTKSRARRSNDNALVESKNGSVVRKHLGYGHIPSRYAAQVNAFTQQVLSPYLNFHRPCFFPVEQVDAKGRVRKRYRDADIMTPYEKLKSLHGAAACLTPGTTFAQLDAVAAALSDNEAAHALNAARDRLFRSIDPAA